MTGTRSMTANPTQPSKTPESWGKKVKIRTLYYSHVTLDGHPGWKVKSEKFPATLNSFPLVIFRLNESGLAADEG